MKVSVQIEKRSREFAQLPNQLLRDKRLSAEALGVLVYLLSYPDDWEVRIPELMERFDVSSRSLRKIFQLLRKNGYATLRALRRSNGDFVGKRYVIREKAMDPTDNGGSITGGVNSSYLKNTDLRLHNRRGSLDLKFEDGSLPDTAAGRLCRDYFNFLSKARLLPKRVVGGKTLVVRPAFKNWIAACEAILQETSVHEFTEVMEWYFDNFRDPYLRTHRSFVNFCNSYDTIQKAMFRQLKRRPEQGNSYPGERDIEVEISDEVDEQDKKQDSWVD